MVFRTETLTLQYSNCDELDILYMTKRTLQIKAFVYNLLQNADWNVDRLQMTSMLFFSIVMQLAIKRDGNHFGSRSVRSGSSHAGTGFRLPRRSFRVCDQYARAAASGGDTATNTVGLGAGTAANGSAGSFSQRAS